MNFKHLENKGLLARITLYFDLNLLIDSGYFNNLYFLALKKPQQSLANCFVHDP